MVTASGMELGGGCVVSTPSAAAHLSEMMQDRRPVALVLLSQSLG